MASPPVRVLFIEASGEAAAPIVASLTGSDRASFEVALVAGVPDAQRRCMTQTFDLVLAGIPLEDPRDLEPLRLLSAQLASTAPLVLLAELSSAPLAHHAVVKGTAQDYLVKGHLEGPLLEQALLYAIERHKMLADLKRRRRDDFAPRSVDRLTHLPNRAAFYDRLGDLLNQARQQAQMVAVMLI